MKCLRDDLILLIIFAVLALPMVFAHAPLGSSDNENLATATVIPDPAKSWAIFTELHEDGEVQYYMFSIDEDERIYVSLLISPASKDKGFTPVMAIIGPGIRSRGSIPNFVEVPEGSGVMVVEGDLPAQASYEAFSPSSFYELAQINLKAPEHGTYYVAVYETSQGGNYGLAVGYVESFTLTEWILTPINLLSIYQWTGQSTTFVFAPMAIVLVVGLGLIVWNKKKIEVPTPLSDLLAVFAGLLFIGTGITVLVQIVVALSRAPLGPGVSVSLIFAAIPAILGVGTIKLALRTDTANTRKRIYVLCIGLLAFFAWSGYLVGPSLAILSSVLGMISSARKK